MRQQQSVSVNSFELSYRIALQVFFNLIRPIDHILSYFLSYLCNFFSNIFDCWSSQQQKLFFGTDSVYFFRPTHAFFEAFYSKQMKQTKLKEKERVCVNKQRKMMVVMMKLNCSMCNLNEHRAQFKYNIFPT